LFALLTRTRSTPPANKVTTSFVRRTKLAPIAVVVGPLGVRKDRAPRSRSAYSFTKFYPMGRRRVGLNRRRTEVFSPLDLPGDAGVVGGGDQVARPVADVSRFDNEDDVLGDVRGM